MNSWMKRSVLVIVATVFAAACGNKPSPASPSPPVAATSTVTAVTVTGAQEISSAGQSNHQMAASAKFSDGTSRDVTTLASWTSSNPAFATISSTGMVTVVGTGGVDVRATYQNVVGAMRVDVTKELTFVLTGVVTDASTQLPLAGVGVRVVGDSEGRTTTGQGGAYALDTHPDTDRIILVEFAKDGYQSEAGVPVLEIYVTMNGDQRRDVVLARIGK